MFKHLLVPTDGSALSEAAIQMAVTLARESGAKVTGLHVIPEFHVLAYGAEVIATPRTSSFRLPDSKRMTTSWSSQKRPRRPVSSAIRSPGTALTHTRRLSAWQRNETVISSSWRLTAEAACAPCCLAVRPRRC